MDTACFDYCLTEDERLQFESNGFFVVEDIIPAQMVEDLNVVIDRLDTQYRDRTSSPKRRTPAPAVISRKRAPTELLSPHERLNLLDFVGTDEIFLELLDWPKTFPKIWAILGWNLQLYHSHMTVTPPAAPGEVEVKKRLEWHQYSGRLNIELEGNPRPRISLKVGFFLTDTTEESRGNFYVVPGSHLQNELEFPGDEASNPEDTLAVRVAPGTAVFFNRRLWHSASPNYSDITR